MNAGFRISRISEVSTPVTCNFAPLSRRDGLALWHVAGTEVSR